MAYLHENLKAKASLGMKLGMKRIQVQAKLKRLKQEREELATMGTTGNHAIRDLDRRIQRLEKSLDCLLKPLPNIVAA